MIDMTKTYRTRCGYSVRIYATDGAGVYRVHGAYFEEGEWIPTVWEISGKHKLRLREGNLDLVEVKPRIQREVWVNVYEGDISITHDTKQEADERATYGRIACVKITIDCEYGEGLEWLRRKC